MRPALLAALLAAAASVRAQQCGCTSDEVCCQDSAGYECCIVQATYCVQPNQSHTKEFPSRCCPQWTVGCQAGSVGCCDPARPWQRKLDARGRAAPVVPGNRTALPAATAGGTVYALFTTTVASDLSCLTIDPKSGDISALLPVKGPAAAYFAKLYGLETRVYPFDPKRSKFWFADIDQLTSAPTSAITLYGIDPATGSSTAATVTGATGFVSSFVLHQETDRLILAVGGRGESNVRFYTVDLDTAAAAKLGGIARGADEASSAAYYAGYLSEASQAGDQLYRLGYREVTQGTGPGIGVTSVTGGTATWSDVPSAKGDEFFYSLVRPPGSASFLSLAPSEAAGHSFAVVQWSAASHNVTVLLNILDAHPPESSGTGVLGYVADTATAEQYAALVVNKKPSVLPGLKDRWEIVSVSLGGGGPAGGTAVLSGKNFEQLGAETVSVAGVGIKG